MPDAIQTDVSTEGQEVEARPQMGIKSRREEMMEYLEGQRNTEFAEEAAVDISTLKSDVGEVNEAGGGEAPVEKQIEEQVAKQVEQPIEKTVEQPKVVEATPDTLVTIKVNGESVQVPLSELAKGYQKDVAGDRKLEAAAAKERELAIREAVLADREARGVKPAEVIPPEKTEPTVDVKEKAKSLAMDLADGEIDKAIPIIAEILSKVERAGDVSEDGGGQVDPVALVDAVTAQVKLQLENDRAYNDFTNTYKAIAEDDDRMKVANIFYREEIDKAHSEGRNITYREAIMAAGERAKKLFNLPEETIPEVKEEVKPRLKTELSTRQERKKTIQNIPSAGVTHAAEKKDEGEANPSATIQKMREERLRGRV